MQRQSSTTARDFYLQLIYKLRDYFRANFTSCPFYNDRIDKNSACLFEANLHDNTFVGQNK